MTFRASKAVFVGDTLKVLAVVSEKLSPKDGRGRVVLEMTVTNQKEETVMSVEGNFLIKERAIGS